jgi:type IV pilus assembly protein PilA
MTSPSMILQAANVCRLTMQEEVMLKSMLQRPREPRAEELEGKGAGEAGFTLIELMVVLLIIAILLAIAIPTFLGVTGGANDRATQSNLTNALTESAAIYQSGGQAYPVTDTLAHVQATYGTTAPEFTWQIAASTSATQISVSKFDVAATGDAQGIAMAAWSKTGSCWYAVDLQVAAPTAGAVGDTALKSTAATTVAGVYYAKDTANAPATNCTAAYVLGKAPAGASYSSVTSI